MTQVKHRPAATPVSTSSEHNLKIGEARNRLPDLVRTVEASSDTYTIGQRGNPSATLLSRKRIEPLLEPNIEPKLALVIVEQLLTGAPLHLQTPAVDELSELSHDDLLKILTIKALPLNQTQARKLKANLKQPEALDRLIKRFELAKAIAHAHKAGLYETAEHETSNV